MDSRIPKAKAFLRRSDFVRGVVITARGIVTDTHVLVHVAKRKSQIARYLNSFSSHRLQLAASNNLLPGWLNTDISLDHKSLVYLDATRRFPFKDNTFDYVLSEHMIEHLPYEGAQLMLRECLRVLKPGGRVRVATPDMRVLLALHLKEKTEAQHTYIQWAVERFMPEVTNCKDVHVINNFFRSWGHQFLYDNDTLYDSLSIAGFEEINFFKPGASDDPNLRNIESHGKQIQSEMINQFETIVIEGRKCSDSESRRNTAINKELVSD